MEISKKDREQIERLIQVHIELAQEVMVGYSKQYKESNDNTRKAEALTNIEQATKQGQYLQGLLERFRAIDGPTWEYVNASIP